MNLTLAVDYASLLRAFETIEIELSSWAAAWARVLPAVALVPAFGLRAVALPVRAAVALMLAASFAPAIRPVAADGQFWPLLLIGEAIRGLPVALTAAVALWTATMAGGLIDNLRGGREHSGLPNVEQGTTHLGALMSVLVAVAFLHTGGPARVAASLAAARPEVVGPLTVAADNLAVGIGLAVAVAAPVLVASIVFEVGAALGARAAAPTVVASLLAPLRSLSILAVSAVLFERMHGLLVVVARTSP
jgi:type III secretory pathway component EscT